MYIIACRAHFCHLPGLGRMDHSPRETSGSDGTLDWGPMWLGSQSTCHPHCPPEILYTPCWPSDALHPLPAPYAPDGLHPTNCWPPESYTPATPMPPTPPTPPAGPCHPYTACQPLMPLHPNPLVTS